MDADGSNPTGVAAPFGAPQRTPAWSPDGQKIAFTCGIQICTMNADGSGLTQLTFTTSGLNSKPV